MKYLFKFKRRWFWQKRYVTGHRYERDTGRMILYFEDGSIEEIIKWSECSAKLGTDFVLALKKDMENKSGQAIPLNIKTGT